ncbi:MAG: hypothetical protein OQJ81_02395 [Melioribacteraceae bacterium]|nr:hypothetical protein [Melioribacteraceae bacterium]
MMLKNGRTFNCCSCNKQVTICKSCDRGQLYCRSECSSLERKISVAKAGKKYQNSPKGKLAHALRQRRYRQKKIQKEKVTHQGSQVKDFDVLITTKEDRLKNEHNFINSNTKEYCYCDFCNEKCLPISQGTQLYEKRLL